jgi:hypothetical protein
MRYVKLLGVMSLFFAGACVQAAVSIIKTDEQFNRALMKYPYSVVYVYTLTDLDKMQRNERYYKVIQETAALQAVSGERRYKKASIHFLFVNATRGGLQKMYTQFPIAAGSSALLLFRKGSLYSKEYETVINRTSIKTFVEKHFKDFIDLRLQKLHEQHMQNKQYNRSKRSYVVYDPYPVPAWPYYGGWGGYYGNSYPGIGFGFSVGI